MCYFQVVERFVAEARSVQTQSDLFNVLESATCEIGFTYFALVHHGDFQNKALNLIQLYNYPSSWVDYFISRRLYAEDPIHVASLLSNVGFSWADVPNKIRITPRQRKILEMADQHGLRNGYTVPANVPGEITGSCSFATRDREDLPKESLLLAELIGDFAFEAARRLGREDAANAPPGPPRLTPRQHDCLLLVIHGKTDKEIARILGISEETVTEYLDHLRHRYRVKKRLTLAIRAIYDGQISFIEALAQEPPLRGG
jgi:LuxR family transcriptional regulator, quorum-sensing system regulator CciR